MMRPYYRFWQLAGQVCLVHLFSGRIYGRHHVPRAGGVIIIANHQSFFDPVLVGLALQRECHFMARDTLFERPAFSWYIRSLNAFPVKRGAGDIAALRESLRRLQQGAAVVAFPEATRTRNGSIGPFHPGVVLMARRGGVPIVTAAIRGAYECWPRHRRWPRRRPIRVAFGPGLSAAQVQAGTPEEVLRALRDEMLALYDRLATR